MIRFSFNLPIKRRLHLEIVKRREGDIDESIFPTIESIKKVRKGSKVSRYFRHVFEHKNMKKIFGVNMTLLIAAKVEAIDRSKYAYGNAVLIDHGNSITSLYAHLSKIEVTVNEEVDMNTEIGEVGATGRSTGDHLHLEIRDHGVPFNPSFVLPK